MHPYSCGHLQAYHCTSVHAMPGWFTTACSFLSCRHFRLGEMLCSACKGARQCRSVQGCTVAPRDRVCSQGALQHSGNCPRKSRHAGEGPAGQVAQQRCAPQAQTGCKLHATHVPEQACHQMWQVRSFAVPPASGMHSALARSSFSIYAGSPNWDAGP